MTPGPWKASVEPRPAGGHFYVVQTEEGDAVGEMYGGRTHEERVANVRLAAAAPTMLAALTSIAQDAAHANDFLGEDTDIEAVLNTIIFQANAALNEGTGQGAED